MGPVLVILLVILVIVAALIFVGRRFSQQSDLDESDPVMARLAEATMRGESVSLEDIELEQPIMERVIVPALRKFGEFSTRFTPQKVLQETTLKLE